MINLLSIEKWVHCKIHFQHRFFHDNKRDTEKVCVLLNSFIGFICNINSFHTEALAYASH